MSWSIRITALYLGFVALIVTLVIISSNNKEELVSKDYYAQELRFQEKIDATNNANSLVNGISHSIDENNVIITLPTENMSSDLKGEVYFFCPSNSANDKTIPMAFDNNGKMFIQKNTLKQGAYKMKLSWSGNGKNYFKESVISIK